MAAPMKTAAGTTSPRLSFARAWRSPKHINNKWYSRKTRASELSRVRKRGTYLPTIRVRVPRTDLDGKVSTQDRHFLRVQPNEVP